MEDISRKRGLWIAVTALAPISWGATYVVTREFLPADSPLWGAALRALPAGLLLLLIARQRPHGVWWAKSLVLGVLNFSGFFVCVYLAAQLLPSSVAASVMALSPFVLAALAALLLRERISVRMVVGAAMGMLGVIMIVGLASGRIDGWGIAASATALLSSSLGAVLTKKWRGDMPVLPLTAWQLVAGGGVLVVVAVGVEGSPPPLDAAGWIAAAFISIVATALAFICWFTGLRHLPAGTVGTVGLLNPVTGVVLGASVAGESVTAAQLVGIVLVLAAIGVGSGWRPRVRGGRSIRSVNS